MANNKVTEADLAAADIMEDPENPGETLPLSNQKADPHEKMSLTELAVCIRGAEQRAYKFAKGESVERFRQGHAVYIAHRHPEMKHGDWGKWCESNKINRTTANRYERLYEKATEEWEDKALENVCQHDLTELYVRFDILRFPPAVVATPSAPAQPSAPVGGDTPPGEGTPLPQRAESRSTGQPETVPEQEDAQEKEGKYKLQATVRIDSDMTPEKLHDLLLTDQVKWVLKNGNKKIVATVGVVSVEGLEHA